ncbi:MAG: acetate kinase [Eubacteriales bacterium]|nr:acetate kinase [Eubacteriales bacterium]
MKILVINAGSSSLKYQLFDMEKEQVVAKGLVERIGIEGSNLVHKPLGKEVLTVAEPIANHVEAVKLVFKALTDERYGVIRSMDEIAAVGHRVLHGGDKFSASVLINEDVKAAIREAIPLGPLHNPANLMGIEACEKVMPTTPQVAVFDTAFHQTMPPQAYLYAIPLSDYRKYKVRRYGFHGTSHKFVSARAAEFLGRPASELRIVTCHLGNGSSLCAVKGGKCVDTSMGLTPLEGVPMGTRSGDIDPAVLEFLCDKKGMNIKEMLVYLNKQCGMKGLSDGLSSDYRDLFAAAAKGNEIAATALETFAYKVRKYIGAYTAAMGGVDAIVFTAGVGENNPIMRKMILDGLEYLGFRLDERKNLGGGDAFEISTDDSRVKVLVIPTNEELVIARDTKALAIDKK